MEMIEAALRAIADPRRREILELVRDQDRSVTEIAAEFDVSRPAISQHLAILIEAELVSVTPIGTRRMYRARPDGLSELRDYLDGFWTHSLARLKDEAEATDPAKQRRR
jgi:DNA-binding transcriptional ArsR family regulator